MNKLKQMDDFDLHLESTCSIDLHPCNMMALSAKLASAPKSTRKWMACGLGWNRFPNQLWKNFFKHFLHTLQTCLSLSVGVHVSPKSLDEFAVFPSFEHKIVNDVVERLQKRTSVNKIFASCSLSVVLFYTDNFGVSFWDRSFCEVLRFKRFGR